MLILSEDQKLLMASARGAVAEKAPIAEFRNLRADPNGLGFSPAFWRASAELGWTGVLVPEAFGGLDFGVVGAGLIAREMARELALSPFLSTSVLSASALARAGSREQNADWLPRIARGEAIVAFALDEGSRHGAIATMATRTDGGWRLDGVKQFVLDGHAADAMLIAAKTGTRRRCFSLQPTRPAFPATPAPSWTDGGSRRSLSTAS
jgi:alkylation response protein AidB-like acyl-CoA dehydrogenase